MDIIHGQQFLDGIQDRSNRFFLSPKSFLIEKFSETFISVYTRWQVMWLRIFLSGDFVWLSSELQSERVLLKDLYLSLHNGMCGAIGDNSGMRWYDREPLLLQVQIWNVSFSVLFISWFVRDDRHSMNNIHRIISIWRSPVPNAVVRPHKPQAADAT